MGGPGSIRFNEDDPLLVVASAHSNVVSPAPEPQLPKFRRFVNLVVSYIFIDPSMDNNLSYMTSQKIFFACEEILVPFSTNNSSK